MRTLFFLFLFLISIKGYATVLSSDQVAGFLGKKVTVCGRVVEISKLKNDIFINIDKPHPLQNFYFYTNNFNDRKILFKNVCGTGVIEEHKGKYQIKISNINQLSIN